MTTRLTSFLTGQKARLRGIIDEHLRLCDARAAIVAQINPLIVAAYTDELDCVSLLHFSAAQQGALEFELDERLLTVNSYVRGTVVAPDLVPGPKMYDRWVNFYPIIADLVSDDRQAIQKAKLKITEDEWTRCAEMAAAYLSRQKVVVRSGSPFYSVRPAEYAIGSLKV